VEFDRLRADVRKILSRVLWHDQVACLCRVERRAFTHKSVFFVGNCICYFLRQFVPRYDVLPSFLFSFIDHLRYL